MILMDELLELAHAIQPFTICGEGNVSCREDPISKLTPDRSSGILFQYIEQPPTKSIGVSLLIAFVIAFGVFDLRFGVL